MVPALHDPRPRRLRDLIARAKAAGVSVLVLTVDLPVVGTRYRDVRNTMSGGGGAWASLRKGPLSYALHPGWVMDVGAER